MAVRPTRGAEQPLECFADEIAIDFPSVGDLVERVRDRFLGEHDGTDGVARHTAEVSLSCRDARIGAVVPLRVPIRGTCDCCGGRGETWTEPCAACGGTGESLVQHPVRLSVPAGVEDGTRLRFRVNAPHAAPLRVEIRVAVRSSAA
jgi:hypothetical protein